MSKIEIQKLIQIAINAGKIILKYHSKNYDIIFKDDGSEVTIADYEANNYINGELQKYYPEIAIISEENEESKNLKSLKNKEVFIVDPLDGTSSFIKAKNGYTVNIAYAHSGEVIDGVIYCPKKDELYFSENKKSYIIENASSNQNKKEIFVTNKHSSLNIIATKREPENSDVRNWCKTNKIEVKNFQDASSSLKFCLVAKGQADLYPRMVNIKIWDIAAGHAILKNAGGNVVFKDKDKKIKEVFYDKNLDAPKFIAYNCQQKILENLS